MAIDASIYNAFKPETYGQRQERMMREQAAAQEREFNALRLQGAKIELQDKQRQHEEEGQLFNALQGAGTDDERLSRLSTLNTPTALKYTDTLRKSMDERAKADAAAKSSKIDTLKKVYDLTKQSLGSVFQNPTKQAALLAIDRVQSETGRDMSSYRQEIEALSTPDDFRRWAIGHSVEADKQLWTFTTRNTGGSTDTIRQDPVTGQVVIANSTKNTQSPDSAASVAATLRGQTLADNRARAALAQSERHFQTSQNNAGNKPVVASEDERKAAGWLAQAENSWKNMREVGLGPDGKPTKDAKPGILETQILLPESVKNMTRSGGRQRFVQASSSMSEAFLRAATGAGMNESEARQKIMEITPQWGDSEEVIKQKFESIPVYLESLRARAGRAVPKQGGGVVDFGSLK